MDNILNHRGAVLNSPIGGLAYLGLPPHTRCRAIPPKPRAAYHDFLTLGKDADFDIPIRKQAKAEYAKLQ